MPEATLRKPERLCQEQIIASLFTAGHRFLNHPLQVVFLPIALPERVPAQIVVSVSKKRFPKAVDRNRIKRLIREAYRLHKQPLYHYLQEKNLQLAIGIVYTGKSLTTFNEINNKIPLALSFLIEQLEKSSNAPDNQI